MVRLLSISIITEWIMPRFIILAVFLLVVDPNGQTAPLFGSGNIYAFSTPAFDVTVYASYVKK